MSMSLRFRNRLLFQEHSTANNAHHRQQINQGSAATEPVAIDSPDVIADVEGKPEGANTHPNDLPVEALLKEQLNTQVRDKQSFNGLIPSCSIASSKLLRFSFMEPWESSVRDLRAACGRS